MCREQYPRHRSFPKMYPLGSQVKRETAGGGVCEMKLDEGGRLSHFFWQTREQVRAQRS